jgi:hypothetical protein
MTKLTVVAAMMLSLALVLSACNLSQQPPTSSDSAAGNGTVIAATSSIPTSTPAGNGGGLPTGTLILVQVGNALAQLPNSSGQTIGLPTERFGSQASYDARYGVRYVKNNNATDLVLVDFSNAADQGKPVPQGSGLSGPAVTWKADNSGFAFYDFPTTGAPKVTGIQYYDLASGQTKTLVPAPAEAGSIAASVAFSPDGKYLIYAVGKSGGEGIGGPDSKLFIFDTSNNQSAQLPATAINFNQWVSDSKTFIAQRFDQKGSNQVLIFSLADLNNPRVVTPANTADYLVDASPDSKFLVVTSAQLNNQGQQPTQIYMMNLDGSNRKALTQFASADQTLTGLVWASDGIYYSVTNADGKDTTWRMDLNGANATQVAQGTLNGIIGAR